MPASPLNTSICHETITPIHNFVRKFHQFEMTHDLFAWDLKGYRFWDYVRHFVYEDIISQKKLRPSLSPPPTKHKKSKFRKLGEELYGVVQYSFRHIFQKTKKTYDIVIFDIGNRRLWNNKWVDPVTYPLTKSLTNKFSILVLDEASFSDAVIGRYPVPTISFRMDYLLSNLWAKFDHFSLAEKERLNLLQELICSEFNVRVDLKTHMKQNFCYQVRLSRKLKKRLTKYKPKLALFQNNFKRYFMQSARDAGIKCVELMHGATNFLDLNTSYPPELRKEAVPTLPDHILTFGRYWNAMFHSPVPKTETGSPYFENWVARIASMNIVRDKKMIIGVSVMDNQLLECLFEFALQARDYTIYYKLRPEEYYSWKKTVPLFMLKQKNLIFIDNDLKPLFDYLRQANYVISTCSTAIYEALYFGTKVLIYKGWYHEMVSDLVQDGYALPIATAQELTEVVKNDVSPPNQQNKELFYKTNATSNLSEEIEKIMRG